MPIYEARVSYTEEVSLVLGFKADNDEHANEVLKENLPPLKDLMIHEVKLVSADEDTTIN